VHSSIDGKIVSVGKQKTRKAKLAFDTSKEDKKVIPS
jgi:hypothetical protein